MKKYESYCIKSNCFKYNFICLLLFCFAGKNSEAQTLNIDIESNKELNYSNLTLWAAHPWKKDNSDSVTIALKKEVRDSSVDVFFIHPTTYTNKKFKNWNASISDETINNKTDQSTILYQASVFNGSCRIFAPRYRQAHINAFYISKEESDKYFDIAYNDIRNAFLYYLKYYNHGRPIIIASHSQGTLHAGRLLKEFFENKELINQLVCAYLVGMPIPEDYFNK